MPDRSYYVSILASQRNGTLYIGVTSDLAKRVYEHKAGLIEGFSSRYQVNQLVYFEQTQDIYIALEREKRLKRWKRAWKIALIENENPHWNDLYSQILGSTSTAFAKSVPGFKRVSLPGLTGQSMDSRLRGNDKKRYKFSKQGTRFRLKDCGNDSPSVCSEPASHPLGLTALLERA